MKGGIGNLMRQAQLMQENMNKQLAAIEVEGQSGGGMVKVAMTCLHEVKRVTIAPGLLAEEREMLEDLVATAINDAVRLAETAKQEKMAAMTAGLPLPPGLKLPF